MAADEQQWYDETGGDLPNLRRILVGRKLSFGDEEIGQRERRIEIAAVDGVIVGIDTHGIFAGILVATTDGDELMLYDNGDVVDANTDATLGRHGLRTPAVKAATT